MSKLFIIENNVCKPREEVLLITPFKEIWDADKSLHKDVAIKQFSFMELYASKTSTNPYAEYTDEQRLKELSKIYLGKEYNDYNELPTNLIQGIYLIEKFQEEGSASMRLYKGLLTSIDRLIDFLNDINPNERNMSGGLVIKPVDILNNVAKANDAYVSLESLKKKIEQEMAESSRTKGGKSINERERV